MKLDPLLNTTLQKLGHAQRDLETILSHDMTDREIIGHTWSVAAANKYQLPYKTMRILESWALRTYGQRN